MAGKLCTKTDAMWRGGVLAMMLHTVDYIVEHVGCECQHVLQCNPLCEAYRRYGRASCSQAAMAAVISTHVEHVCLQQMP